jgi:hypothetical protein
MKNHKHMFKRRSKVVLALKTAFVTPGDSGTGKFLFIMGNAIEGGRW